MFDRLIKLFKGWFGLFVSDLETRNPKALLEAETNALSEAIANYNVNLAKQAALIERLKGQLIRQKKELELTTAKARAVLAAQQMEEAGKLALQVKKLQGEIVDNEAQSKSAEEMYVNLSKQRDIYANDAKSRIEQIKQKMSKAEIAESQAKLAEIASTTAFSMSGSGATLQRLDEKLDERVAQATGKARVAQDMARGGAWQEKENEEKALQAQALAEFAATMGMEVPGAGPPVAIPGAAPATRELGPTQGA
ncbi:MAG TPA: PspA/IM30 family protein [Candidatus Xenobia bacterium]